MPSYPSYRATPTGYKTYKLISSSLRTVAIIDGSGDFYSYVGGTTVSESGIIAGTVEISSTEFDAVVSDIESTFRVGSRPHVTPH